MVGTEEYLPAKTKHCKMKAYYKHKDERCIQIVYVIYKYINYIFHYNQKTTSL